jgi:hypothetical protein
MFSTPVREPERAELCPPDRLTLTLTLTLTQGKLSEQCDDWLRAGAINVVYKRTSGGYGIIVPM